MKKIITYDNNDGPFLIEQIVTQAEVHAQSAISCTITRAFQSCLNNISPNCPINENIMRRERENERAVLVKWSNNNIVLF